MLEGMPPFDLSETMEPKMKDEFTSDAQNIRNEVQASEERERRSEFLKLCSQKRSEVLTVLDEKFGPGSGDGMYMEENFFEISPRSIGVKNTNGEREFHNTTHAIIIANGTVDTLAHLYFSDRFDNRESLGLVMARLEEQYLNGKLEGEHAEKFEYIKSIEVVALAHDLVQDFSLEVYKDAHATIGRNRRMYEITNENNTILQTLTILMEPDELAAAAAKGIDSSAGVGKFNLTFDELYTTVRATVPASNFAELGGGRANLDISQRDLTATLAEIPSDVTTLSWKDRRRFEAAFAIATSDLRELSGGPSPEVYMNSAHSLLHEVKFGLQDYLRGNAEKLDAPEVQADFAHIIREVVFWYGAQQHFVKNQQRHFDVTLEGIGTLVKNDTFVDYMRAKYSDANYNRNADAAAGFFADLKSVHGKFIYQVLREGYDRWENSDSRNLTLDYVCGQLIDRLFDDADKDELARWYDEENNRLTPSQKATNMGSMLRSAQYKVADKFVDTALVVTVKDAPNYPEPA